MIMIHHIHVCNSFFNLCQSPSFKKPKFRPLRAQSQTILVIERSLKINGLTINRNILLPSEIFDPVVILAKEDLCVPVKNSRMVEDKIANGVLADSHGKFFVRL